LQRRAHEDLRGRRQRRDRGAAGAAPGARWARVATTTRSPDKAAVLRDAGATPVVLDALDRDAVIAAV
jgi:hypothetical protein